MQKHTMQDMQLFEDILYKILQIAITAGKIIMSFHGNTNYMQKADKSPLTQADLESNAYITAQLQAISPYKVCSEEAILPYNERKDLDYFWLIDPLDGTKDFLAGNGNFTINIALLWHSEVVLGVVYAPYLYEAYIGLRGFGGFSYNIADFKTFVHTHKETITQSTWLKDNKILLCKDNAKRIYGESLEYLNNVDLSLKAHILANLATTQHEDSYKEQLIACDSLFHSTAVTQEFLQRYNALVLQRGSSLKICSLASGIAHIYPRMNGTSEWDTAASDIILQESGGIMLDICTKKPLVYNKESMRNNHFIAFADTHICSNIYHDIMQL